MHVKKLPGSPESNLPDDAPALTAAMLDDAEVFDGDKFVRRGRGRPPVDSPKEKINARLDQEVLQRLRASGPGWQTRINQGLAMLTAVDQRLWMFIENAISENEKHVEMLRQIVGALEAGTMRSSKNNRDTTQEELERSRIAIAEWQDAIGIMRSTQADLLARYVGRDALAQLS